MKKLALALLLVSGASQAQQPWNENVIAWDAPTSCTSGQPLTSCPVTGYQILRSPLVNGAFAPVGTSATTTFTHIVNATGQSCYKVVALSAQGNSEPSAATACKVNTQPSGPPNPPTNTRFVTLAVVRAGAPAFSVLGQTPPFRVGEFYGVIPAGRPCGDYLVTFRGQRLHRVIPQTGETWGDFGSRPLAAPCGAAA